MIFFFFKKIIFSNLIWFLNWISMWNFKIINFMSFEWDNFLYFSSFLSEKCGILDQWIENWFVTFSHNQRNSITLNWMSFLSFWRINALNRTLRISENLDESIFMESAKTIHKIGSFTHSWMIKRVMYLVHVPNIPIQINVFWKLNKMFPNGVKIHSCFFNANKKMHSL